jgi:anhydro-N-acetylmuramic acid kinase
LKVLGLISGTSHDGIDYAVVDLAVTDGELRGVVGPAGSRPYPSGLRTDLVRALPPAGLTFAEVCDLDTRIGQAFAEVAAWVAGAAGGVDLVCSHGQTVYHQVAGGRVLGTLQIGQPAWIAERTGVPVVADLRVRDVAAGGQGAPLVALPDLLLLAGLPGRPAALNLGGIANLTVPRPAGGGAPLAYDTGPGNALLDAAAVRVTRGRADHDTDGRLAAAGRVDQRLLTRLLADPYYHREPPRSTGKELFHTGYLDRALTGHPEPTGPDLLATVTALTAVTVADQVRRHQVDLVVASGGGCANPSLMAMLRDRLPGARVVDSGRFGAPVDTKEAIAFAVLGWHTAHGLPGTVASCTGATGPRVLGTVLPGAGPLRLPEPSGTAPVSLRLSAARA